MGRDEQTMTVQAPRDVWAAVKDRAIEAGREDLATVIDDAVAAVPATKHTIRITDAVDVTAALYALSVPTVAPEEPAHDDDDAED